MKKVSHWGNKDDILNFRNAVETGNIHEIRMMIRKEFVLWFGLENLMLKLQRCLMIFDEYDEDGVLINGNIDEIIEVIKMNVSDKTGEYWKIIKW